MGCMWGDERVGLFVALDMRPCTVHHYEDFFSFSFLSVLMAIRLENRKNVGQGCRLSIASCIFVCGLKWLRLVGKDVKHWHKNKTLQNYQYIALGIKQNMHK